MTALAKTPIGKWLKYENTERQDVFVVRFSEHFIGNPLIRSLHGGIVGTMVEAVACEAVRHHFASLNLSPETEVTSTSINYLRVTKDADLYGKFEIVRIARRIAFVDVWCWQDGEDLPVAKGNCVLRIMQ